MSNHLFNTVTLLASIIRAEMKTQPGKGVGMKIGSYWMTPEECWYIQMAIFEANNQAYGVNKWTIDKDVINYLNLRTYQNEADFDIF